jgi:hypothetical protein
MGDLPMMILVVKLPAKNHNVFSTSSAQLVHLAISDQLCSEPVLNFVSALFSSATQFDL